MLLKIALFHPFLCLSNIRVCVCVCVCACVRACVCVCRWIWIYWRRAWQPTIIFLPGESHGPRSLVGYRPRDCRVGYNWATSLSHTKDEGCPCGSGKESTCNVGDLGLIPGLGRSPGEGKGYPLQYSGLENSTDYPWVHKELDMTEWLSLHTKNEGTKAEITIKFTRFVNNEVNFKYRPEPRLYF